MNIGISTPKSWHQPKDKKKKGIGVKKNKSIIDEIILCKKMIRNEKNNDANFRNKLNYTSCL